MQMRLNMQSEHINKILTRFPQLASVQLCPEKPIADQLEMIISMIRAPTANCQTQIETMKEVIDQQEYRIQRQLINPQDDTDLMTHQDSSSLIPSSLPSCNNLLQTRMQQDIWSWHCESTISIIADKSYGWFDGQN